jgi:hypothetical protein
MHKGVGALGGFSAKTIFCNAGWNFPVRFDHDDGLIVMRVTRQLAQKFDLPLRNSDDAKRFGIFEFVDVDTASLGVRPLRTGLSSQSNPIIDLAIYEDVMRFGSDCCRKAFPGADILISDASAFSRRPLPIRPNHAGGEATGFRTSKAAIAVPQLGQTSRRGWRPFRKLGHLVGDAKAQSLDKAKRLLASSSLFDADWYLSKYPDVAANDADPIRHYLEFGWREGRNPSPLFSTNNYLKANKDVAERGINPLLHYLEHGQMEGRTAPPARKDTSIP